MIKENQEILIRHLIHFDILDYEKASFFRDDDFEHMAFSVVAKWGESGRTTIRICELSQWKKSIFK